MWDGSLHSDFNYIGGGGRRNLTRSLSQNGARASRFTPPPASKRTRHPAFPVHKVLRTRPGQIDQEIKNPALSPFEPFELPHRPGHQRFALHRLHLDGVVLGAGPGHQLIDATGLPAVDDRSVALVA